MEKNEGLEGIQITSFLVEVNGKPTLIPVKNIVDIDMETNTVTVITNAGIAAIEMEREENEEDDSNV